MYPKLGRTCGHAVTCVFGEKDHNYPDRLGWCDVLDEIEKAPKPVILVMKHDFPDDMKDKVGLLGGNMATHLKTMGCEGVIQDGPARDIDEIAPLDL